jgi:hypothetical protein
VVIPASGIPTGLVLLIDLGLGALSGIAGALIALNRIHRTPRVAVAEDSGQ